MEKDETEHLMKGENGKILKESIGQLKTNKNERMEVVIQILVSIAGLLTGMFLVKYISGDYDN